MQTISTKKVLETMENGLPFSCTVVSYDRRRKGKTGILKEYPEAILETGKIKNNTGRPWTEQEKLKHKLANPSKVYKNPNHKRWYTRNIRELLNGHPINIVRSIHPPLIIKFNGQTVTP